MSVKYKLICGDCLEVIKRIPDNSIDLLLCDPPYGIDFQSGRRKERFAKIQNDKEPFIDFIKPIIPKIKGNGGGFIFTRWDVQSIFIKELNKVGIKPKNVIIWDKVIHGMGDLKRAFGSRYESIIWFTNKGFAFPNKRPTDILRFTRVSPNNQVHPNEKPIDLLKKLIQLTTKENDLVVDCFMGSGSTGVAAVSLSRNFLGIEIDEKYYNIAKDRIEKEMRCLK